MFNFGDNGQPFHLCLKRLPGPLFVTATVHMLDWQSIIRFMISKRKNPWLASKHSQALFSWRVILALLVCGIGLLALSTAVTGAFYSILIIVGLLCIGLVIIQFPFL